jgi:hypothetical protein
MDEAFCFFGVSFAPFAQKRAFGLPRDQNGWLSVYGARTALQWRSYRRDGDESVKIQPGISKESSLLIVETKGSVHLSVHFADLTALLSKIAKTKSLTFPQNGK